ncbi:flavodoxin domain-containing protein [Phyllobacterium sp.]|uniref:flavodoxin domain-containing protein n=1 Tax=Phyllobacterium sp. TaxID=1871046 RepID=UPI0030F4A932
MGTDERWGIFCTPVHVGRYSAAFAHFVRERSAVLNRMQSAFISVSLFLASTVADDKEEPRNYALKLIKETAWKRRTMLNRAGALKYTEYYFSQTLDAQTHHSHRGRAD